MVKINKK